MEAAKKKKKGKKEGDGKKKKKGKKKKGDGTKKGKGKKKKAGNNEDLVTELSEPVGGDAQPEEGQEDEPEGDEDDKDEEPEEGEPGEESQQPTEDENSSLPRRVIKVKSDGSVKEDDGEEEQDTLSGAPKLSKLQKRKRVTEDGEEEVIEERDGEDEDNSGEEDLRDQGESRLDEGDD